MFIPLPKKKEFIVTIISAFFCHYYRYLYYSKDSLSRYFGHTVIFLCFGHHNLWSWNGSDCTNSAHKFSTITSILGEVERGEREQQDWQLLFKHKHFLCSAPYDDKVNTKTGFRCLWPYIKVKYFCNVPTLSPLPSE